MTSSLRLADLRRAGALARRRPVALCAALCLAGCSGSMPRVNVDTLSISVATQANLDTPIPLDATLH